MKSLFQALQEQFPNSSNRTIKSWILNKRIQINGNIVTKPHFILPSKADIQLKNKQKHPLKNFLIYYEDEDILVLEKPPKLLTVDEDTKKHPSLHHKLKQAYPKRRIYPIHRLDRDASGVLVFAFTKEAQEQLKVQFQQHSVFREYNAITHNTPYPFKGTWKHYLKEDKNYVVKQSSKEEGVLAITHYEVLNTNQKFSWIRFVLETGKKNQIRAQCKIMNFPIYGDPKYGKKQDGASRLFLHAVSLAFEHPITKKKMQFQSKLPLAFEKTFHI